MTIRIKYWTQVGVCVVFIYGSLYFVRPVCEFLKSAMPLSFVINVFLTALLGSIILLNYQKVRCLTLRSWFLLCAVSSLYIVGLLIVKIPEERIHFLEYGFLVFLVFRALRIDIKGVSSYFFAFLITSFIGLGDEGIQYLLPNRYYQTEDVILNCISAALGLLLIFALTRSKEKLSKIRNR